MKLESRKVLTAKKIGIAVFIILVMFIATRNFPKTVNNHCHIPLNRIKELTTMVTGRYKTVSITEIIPNKITMKITKTINKAVLKSTPKKTTIKMLSNTSSKNLRKKNLKMSFQKTAMATGSYTTLTTKVNYRKDTTTMKTTKAKTTTRNVTTKIPELTNTKIFTITAFLNSSVDGQTLKTSTVHLKTTASRKHFLCINLMGRLGNIMFQYASAYGVARSKGMDVIVSRNERIAQIFHLEGGGKIVKDTSMCKGLQTIHEIRACAYDKKTVDFSNSEDTVLHGYLQSYKYFEDVSDEIRQQFTFRGQIRNEANNVIRGILQHHLQKHNKVIQEWTFVGVHVRRGDMVNHSYGYMVAPQKYFQRAQKMFRTLKQNVIFVICSDVTEWCKDHLESNDTYIVKGHDPEVDMAILSSCNHTISSVGSFSWWSAWLSNGLVTYYSPPVRPGSELRIQYSKDFSDFFPTNWIRVTS